MRLLRLIFPAIGVASGTGVYCRCCLVSLVAGERDDCIADDDDVCVLQEGVKTENDHINLKVAGQDGSVVQFKIKRHTPLSKLMKAYCERQVSSFCKTLQGAETSHSHCAGLLLH